MQILFMPSVGKGFGQGNLLRCLAVADEFPESVTVFFHIPPEALGKYAMPPGIQLFSTQADFRRLLPLLDCVVYDYQGPVQASSVFAEIKAVALEQPIVAMDYFFLDERNIDALINLTDHFERKWPTGKPPYAYYSGLDYAVIRPAFKRFRPCKPDYSKQVERVLITFGGEDPADWTLRSCHWLEAWIEKKMAVDICIGPMYRGVRNLKKFLDEKTQHRYHLLGHVFDIERLMDHADLIICGGGTTLMEAAYLGKPAVAVPQHEMERKLIALFERHGYLLPGYEPCFRKLTDGTVLDLFDNPQLRQRAGKIGLGLVDGRGAQRIAEIILGSIRGKRPAVA